MTLTLEELRSVKDWITSYKQLVSRIGKAELDGLCSHVYAFKELEASLAGPLKDNSPYFNRDLCAFPHDE